MVRLELQAQLPVGIEWIIFIILFIIFYIFLRERKRRIESIVVSIIRSHNGATLDDIIIGAHLSSAQASRVVQYLISKNVIKPQEREGKTIYIPA